MNNTLRAFVPRSLFGRLVLVWLACFILLRVISFCDVTRRSDQLFLKVLIDTEARLMALQTRIFIKQPELWDDLAGKLNKVRDLNIALVPDSEMFPATDDTLSAEMKTSLEAMLGPARLEKSAVRAKVKLLRRLPPSGEDEPAGGDGAPTRWRERAAVVKGGFRLPDGRWLVIAHRIDMLPDMVLRFHLSRLLGEMALMVILAFTTVFWIVRPLRHLARATEEFGWDLDTPPLSENGGPQEIRDAARAFNSMRGRIRAFVQERAHLLGAVSHDLRTPLTRMRLRLEGVQDETLREQLRRDVEGMQHSLDLALTLSRSMNAAEAPEAPDRLDITALLESLADDRQDMGQNVRVSGAFPGSVWLPPLLVQRCLNNLVDNALRYGKEAEIRVRREACPPDAGRHRRGREDSASGRVRELVKKLLGRYPAQVRDAAPRRPVRVRIEVLDKGPGIPEAYLEKVFTPFFRLEPSRNPRTGGHGLGLAIARMLARKTGGDVILSNRPEGGLCATLILEGEELASEALGV